jgi:hypothetical protein
MASTEMLITLPADEDLVAQITRRLSVNAEVVRWFPQKPSPETISLIIAVAGLAASATGAFEDLLAVKQLLQEQHQAAYAHITASSGEQRCFTDLDELFLKHLLRLA